MSPKSYIIISATLDNLYESLVATKLHLEYQVSLQTKFRVVEDSTDELNAQITQLKIKCHEISTAKDELEADHKGKVTHN
jgi:hypothetical protein